MGEALEGSGDVRPLWSYAAKDRSETQGTSCRCSGVRGFIKAQKFIEAPILPHTRNPQPQELNPKPESIL